MQNSGTLYIVATPIGNLGDITLRALETLKIVDAVLCEDTRVTGKLLARYEIQKSMVSCHEHTDDAKLAHIVERLKNGESLAFASDAGTPGLSDPGNKLVSLALASEIPVVPIPGVSALATIVSVAGIDMREFVFLGFPPHKKGRETFFKKVAVTEYPVMYYESPHRVIKNLDLLESLLKNSPPIIKNPLVGSDSGIPAAKPGSSLGIIPIVPRSSWPFRSEFRNREPDMNFSTDSETFPPERKVIIGRELTKMFEEVLRGSIEDMRNYFIANPGKQKGEFVVVIYPVKSSQSEVSTSVNNFIG